MDSLIFFVITISILVFVHEFGHFAAAKICRMRTDVFAIGFGKRLFGWNKINGFTFGNLPEDIDLQGHTDYRLSILPLGGYVKISGMVDESFDTDFAGKEPQPYEFRSKPVYQKLFVITAGVLMNFLLTVFIFWGINIYSGKPILSTTKIGYIAPESFAEKAGFSEGDKIISVNNKKVTDWESVFSEVLMASAGKSAEIKVLRNEKPVTLKIGKPVLSKIEPSAEFLNMGDVIPVAGKVIENSPAEDAGIKNGDQVIELKGMPIKWTNQIYKIMEENKDDSVLVKILRDGKEIEIASKLDMEGKMGVFFVSKYTGKRDTVSYSLMEGLSATFDNIGNTIGLTFAMFRKVIFGEVAFGKVFGGPLKIAEMAGDTAEMGVSVFLSFLASLSLSLAIINILPFPVLDGGHVIMILIEGIIRKEVPIKVKLWINNIGFALLMLLMAFIIYSDALSMF